MIHSFCNLFRLSTNTYTLNRLSSKHLLKHIDVERGRSQIQIQGSAGKPRGLPAYLANCPRQCHLASARSHQSQSTRLSQSASPYVDSRSELTQSDILTKLAGELESSLSLSGAEVLMDSRSTKLPSLNSQVLFNVTFLILMVVSTPLSLKLFAGPAKPGAAAQAVLVLGHIWMEQKQLYREKKQRCLIW